MRMQSGCDSGLRMTTEYKKVSSELRDAAVNPFRDRAAVDYDFSIHIHFLQYLLKRFPGSLYCPNARIRLRGVRDQRIRGGGHMKNQ